jgi:hypothetical protein
MLCAFEIGTQAGGDAAIAAWPSRDYGPPGCACAAHPGTIEAWHHVVAQSIKGWATGYLHQAAATLSALAMSSMIIKAAPKKPTRTCGTVLDVLFMA